MGYFIFSFLHKVWILHAFYTYSTYQPSLTAFPVLRCHTWLLVTANANDTCWADLQHQALLWVLYIESLFPSLALWGRHQEIEAQRPWIAHLMSRENVAKWRAEPRHSGSRARALITVHRHPRGAFLWDSCSGQVGVLFSHWDTSSVLPWACSSMGSHIPWKRTPGIPLGNWTLAAQVLGRQNLSGPQGASETCLSVLPAEHSRRWPAHLQRRKKPGFASQPPSVFSILYIPIRRGSGPGESRQNTHMWQKDDPNTHI